LIYDLRQIGYQAEGIDPFIAADVADEYGTRVRKLGINQVINRYDIIIFRHSLEHMPDQVGTLAAARDKLLPGGTLVACIPVIGWAWRQYGVHWSELDAPRHLFLHTPQSLRLAAEKAHLGVERVVYDSNDFQFWASELYRQGKQLNGGGRPGPLKILSMRRRAAELNRQGDGDRAQFYLRPV
jgi:SAM-dependent methyltransferase